jgi:hypothetical protein
MKNGKHGVIAQIAGPGLVLAALLALALSNPAIGRAQSESASATAATTPAQATAAAPNSPVQKPSANGQNEGIHVHGHWTIEVRNPDGKLVTHREFENSLSGGDGGAILLSSIISRVATAGAWEVQLADSGSLLNIVQIDEPGSGAYAACPAFVLHLQSLQGTGSCSNTLAVSGSTFTASGGIGTPGGNGTLTLTGSGTVPFGYPASIGFVMTTNYLCPASETPASCASDQSSVSYTPLTIKSLYGAAGTATAPVPVTAGQTVAVTVVISFASGS